MGGDQHYIHSHLDKGYTLQHDQSCILLGHNHRWWGGWGVTNITYPAIWTRAILCSMTKAVFCWVMITGGGVGVGGGVTNITYPAIWTRATLCSMTKAVFCWVTITGGGVGGDDQHYIPSHLDKGYTLQHDQSCILLGHDHRWWGGWGVTNITYPAIWKRATLCSMTEAVFCWVTITGGGVGGGDQHYIPSHLDKGYTLQHDQSCILLGHNHRWWGGWE